MSACAAPPSRRRAWPSDVPAPARAPAGELEQRPALAAVDIDWNDPVTLRGALVELRESEQGAQSIAMFALVAIRWLVARRPLEPSSPGAERLVIRAVVTKASGRGVFKGITVDSFTDPCRRALWGYLTARTVLPAALRPAAWELEAELEACEDAGDPTAEEARAAVAEVLADQRRRDAIHAARSAAHALERRLDQTGAEQLERAVKARGRAL